MTNFDQVKMEELQQNHITLPVSSIPSDVQFDESKTVVLLNDNEYLHSGDQMQDTDTGVMIEQAVVEEHV